MRIGQMAVRRVLVCNKSRALTRARDKHTPNLSGPGKRIKQEAFRARRFAANTPCEWPRLSPEESLLFFNSFFLTGFLRDGLGRVALVCSRAASWRPVRLKLPTISTDLAIRRALVLIQVN